MQGFYLIPSIFTTQRLYTEPGTKAKRKAATNTRWDQRGDKDLSLLLLSLRNQVPWGHEDLSPSAAPPLGGDLKTEFKYECDHLRN